MYGQLALRVSTSQTHKTQKMLSRSRANLDTFKELLTRSAENLARSRDSLSRTSYRDPGCTFRRPTNTDR